MSAVRTSAATVLAVLICAALLFGDPAGVGAVARVAAAGLSFYWAWMFARRAARGPGEQKSWQDFSMAAAWVGVALLGKAVVDQLIGAGQLGPAWAGVGFGLISLASWSYLFLGLVNWNPLRVEESDLGDWLNGMSGGLAGVAIADLLIRATSSPMAGWSTRQEFFWLGHAVALLILFLAAVTVANLGGMAHDRRVLAVATVLAVGTCVQVALGFLDRPALARLSILVAWVAVLAVVGACADLVPATPRPRRTTTSQSPFIGALVVVGVGAGVLALDGFVGEAHASTSVIAAIAVVGGGIRVLQLVTSLGQLGQSQLEARTDDLTGIANRRALAAALGAATADRRDAALLVVDLDRFKEINDHHGHAVGDEVLRAMAERLRERLPPDALLGRLGGDEFAVLLLGAAAEQATSVAQALIETCTESVETSAGQMSVGASVGVATTGARSDEAVDLMRHADTAMYVAKRNGGGVASFDAEADHEAQRQRQLLAELRWLLGPDATPADRDQILVHFQPQLSARTGDVVGVEALVRWRHPEHGVLFPDAFLELVERHGLMFELTRTVLHNAARETRRWAALGRRPRLAVNLSASSLVDPDLLSMVDHEVAESGIEPYQLTLEITETTLMIDPERALDVMRQLAGRRIGISIDDYGTGYSSLAYLNDLPAKELKLDRKFTSRVLHDQRTASIIAGTVDIAHGLGLRIIAEGVEDEATLVVLRKLGCDETQGYLHAKPMPADYFLRWLARFSPSPVASPDTRVAT